MTRVLVGAAEPEPPPEPLVSFMGTVNTGTGTSALFWLSHLPEPPPERGPIRVQAEVGRPLPEIGGGPACP